MSQFGPFFTEERKAASNASPIAGQAYMADGFIFVTGQTPSTLEGKPIEGSFEDKVTQSCSNIKAILEQAGSDISQVVKVTVLLDDIERVQDMNAVYRKFFPHMPARTCFSVKSLPRGSPIEIECMARQGKGASA